MRPADSSHRARHGDSHTTSMAHLRPSMSALARMLPLLLVSLLLLLLSPLPSSGAPAPSSAVLGVIVPLTGDGAPDGQRVRSVLSMLVAEVNGGASVGGFPASHLGGVPLTLAFADSAGSVVQALRALHTLRATHGARLMGVIGDLNDEVTVPLSLLASRLGVPLISPGARSPSLSVKDEHALFARTAPSEDLFARLWASAMPILSWHRVAMITVSDDNGRGFADLLLRTTSAYRGYDAVLNVTTRPFDVQSVVLPATEGSDTVNAVAQMLDQLKSTRMRIFVLHAGQLNERVLRMAHERQMIGLGDDGVLRQWAGQFCTDEIEQAAFNTPELLYGTICNTAPVPRVWPDLPLNPVAVDFERRLRAFDPVLFPSTRHITHLEVEAGSALYAFVGLLGSAFANPSLSNSGADVMGQLRQRGGMQLVQPDGTSMFLTADGDALLNPDIRCWNMAHRRFVVCGIFDLAAGAFNHTSWGITYVTGGRERPKDRDRVYITGDVLPATLDGKIVVLAFVVIVLGAWTALILLEQALSFWSRGLWKHAVFWVALSGLAFGTASVWPNGVLLVSSLTLDVDAILNLTLWSLAVGAVYPSVLMFLAFLVALHGVDGGRKPAANVNADEISAVTGQSSTTGSAVSGSDGKAAFGSTNQRSRFRMARNALNKQAGKFKDFCIDTAKRSWVQLLVSAALLTATFATHTVLSFEGFYLRATFHLDYGIMGAMVVVCTLLNAVALAMYFHVTRSGARYLAPFVLCVSLMVTILVVIQASEWRYDSTVDISDEGLKGTVPADYTTAVVVAAIGASLCVLLMALNVNRLRVSRNALDKVLAQVGGQVRALESDIDDEKEQQAALKEQAQYFRRALEVINLCRPVWRPYSVALAMADPDDEQAKAARAKLAAEAAALAAAAAAAAGGGVSGDHGTPIRKRGGPKERSLTGPQSDDDEEHLVSGNPVSVEKKPPAGRKRSVDPAGMGAGGTRGAPGVSGGGGEQSQSAHKSGTGTVPSGTGATTGTVPLPGAASSPEQKVRKVTTRPAAAAAGAVVAPAAAAKTAQKDAPSDFSRVHCPKHEKQLMTLLKELDDLSLSNPAPSRVTADIRLPQVLSHPMTIELIKDVLAKNLSPENIALWIDIQRYRSLENAQVRKAVADEICQTFIVTGAKFEVNISSFMRDYVRAQVQKGSSAMDLFDEVEREIYRLMVTNNHEPLAQSHMIKLAAIVLQHPTYKLPSAALVNNARGEVGGNVPNGIGVVQQQQQQQAPHLVPSGYVYAPAGSQGRDSFGRQHSGAGHGAVIHVQPASNAHDRAISSGGGTGSGLHQRPVAAAAAATAGAPPSPQLARHHLTSSSGPTAGYTLVRSNTFNRLRPE